MRKKILSQFSVCVFLFLIFCTFASVQVKKMLVPQVVVTEAVPGTLIVDGIETDYEYTVPLSALEKSEETYFVYYLHETDGRFGNEHRVIRMDINVIAEDGNLAALKSQGFFEMVVSTNKTLQDNMVVMVQDNIS